MISIDDVAIDPVWVETWKGQLEAYRALTGADAESWPDESLYVEPDGSLRVWLDLGPEVGMPPKLLIPPSAWMHTGSTEGN
jgi:hypothetical protein